MELSCCKEKTRTDHRALFPFQAGKAQPSARTHCQKQKTPPSQSLFIRLRGGILFIEHNRNAVYLGSSASPGSAAQTSKKKSYMGIRPEKDSASSSGSCLSKSLSPKKFSYPTLKWRRLYQGFSSSPLSPLGRLYSPPHKRLCSRWGIPFTSLSKRVRSRSMCLRKASA